MSSRDLSTLLAHASEHLPETDLAESAWRRAVGEQRRRRRTGLTVVAAAAAAAVAIAVIPSVGDHGSPVTPRPSPTTAGEGRTTQGMPFVTAPGAGTEDKLPQIDAGIPTTLDLRGAIYQLGDIKLRRVTAVVLKQLSADTYRPVLVGSQGTNIGVDSITLNMPPGDGLHRDVPLSPGAVAPDGHHVVFPDTTGVTVLDSESGAVTRVAVPGAKGRLTEAGWSVAGDQVITSSPLTSWEVDPATRSVRGLQGRVPAGHYGVTGPRISRPELDTYNARGQQVGSVALAAPAVDPWLQPVSNTLGWVAQAVFTNTEAGTPIPSSYQGILAVQGDVPSTVRLLAMPDDSRFKGCCQPLGWLGGVHLLFTTRGGPQDTWLLSWNVVTGEVEKVSKVAVPALALGPLDF